VCQVIISMVVCTRDILQHGSATATQRRNCSSSEYVEFVRICEHNDWRLRPYLPRRETLLAAELDRFIEMGLKTTRQSTRQQFTCLDERFRRRRSSSWISGYRNPYSITDVRINRKRRSIDCAVVWDHFAAPCSQGIAHRGVLPCTRKWIRLQRIPVLRAL
jgi:hypothetical protein